MALKKYDGRMVRLTDLNGRVFTGTAAHNSADYCMHEYGREEESLNLNGYLVYQSEIRQIERLPHVEVQRITNPRKQAGAYDASEQTEEKKRGGMFPWEPDEHDGPEARHIVVTDHDGPIAAARMYPLDEKNMMIDRVTVLPEYRHQGIGTMVVAECEEWAEELSFAGTVLESRGDKAAFWEEMGYEICGGPAEGDPFRRVRMKKEL